MAKLEKLTKKQEALMRVVRDEWVNHALRGAFDEEGVREGVAFIYSLIGRPAPRIVIVDSPLGCQLAYQAMNEPSVGASVRDSVWDSVRDSVRDSVWASVWDSVWDSVRDSVRASVWDSVGASVWDSVRASVWDSVRDSQDFSMASVLWSADWTSFYDYFRRIGVLKDERFERWVRFLKSNPSMTRYYENVAIISKPPAYIHTDERGRLDATNGPAIGWNDGYCIYAVKGVRFDKDLYTKAFIEHTLTPTDILGLQNAEQRAVLIQEYGYECVLRDLLHKKVLDEYTGKSELTGKPVSYQLIEFDIDNLTARVIRVECHTTHKVTVLGVPREEGTSTCLGAIAWTFGLSKEEYVPEVET